MFEDMGRPGTGDDQWRSCAEVWFRQRLRGHGVVCFVAEAAEGDVVAAARGEIIDQPPSPSNPQGVAGRVSNVVTAPWARRQGHARSCVDELICWFSETKVGDIDLFATGDGSDLYESLGFKSRPYPAMRLHIDR